MPLAIHRMYRTSAQEIQPSRLASGSHTNPSSAVTKAAMKLHPAAGTANKLDSGATSTKMRKYQAVSGAVNTTALRVADRFAATKHSAARSGRHLPLYHPVSSLYSRGDSSTIPSVAEKLSCKLTLAAAIWVNRQDYQYGVLTALTLDVGQGESVILTSGGETALVDCGSSNSYKDPGGLAADTLHSMGVRKLSAVVVTHYHADHTNGLYEVLRRIPVQTIYLPDIEDEYGVRERLVSLAEEKGAQVTYVTKETADTLGDTVLTIYPPVQSGGDLNELGLTALASAGDFDLLITGDMSGSTEKKLVETYALPDIEVLVVSHHGSRYSSNIRFLKSVTPEAAVISVGDNNYGHPSEETLQRLLAVGADIWRTDQQGTIRITVNGG